MARYEDGKSFWHVVRTGTAVVVTTGKLGRKGRTISKTLPSIGAAQAHHDDLVLARLRDGFAKVDETAIAQPPGSEPGDDPDDRLAALEARIAEDPADAEAWIVYGDLLQRRGDPRGEFAALARAAERPGAKPATRLAATRFFAKHATALLGSLARYVPSTRDPAAPPFAWKHGTIHRAELATGDVAVAHILDELLSHASGRLVGEVSLRLESTAEATDALAAIARHAPPILHDVELVVRGDLGDELAALGPSLPHLRRLALTARSIELTGDTLAGLPPLHRLRVFALGPSPTTIRAIATAPWPRLERLELRLGAQLGRLAPEFADLAPLFSRADLQALTHLKIRNAPYAGAIARAVAAGPLAARLVVLDLCHGSLTPNDTRALADAAGRFPRLRELWVPAAADPRPLAGLAKHVVPDTRAPIDTLASDLGTAPRFDGDRYEDLAE